LTSFARHKQLRTKTRDLMLQHRKGRMTKTTMPLKS
jgi:hypothetical protein